MTPDVYDIIASIGHGHAFDKHVLGYKDGHDHYGVNEFTDRHERFGEALLVETEDQFAKIILDVVNDRNTRAFYDVDQNIVTMANVSRNVIVNFNHSPVHGDAGSAYRVFNPDGDRVNQKYKRAFSEAQSTDNLVIEARSPDEAKAFVERFANTKDFTKVSHRSTRNFSAFDKMVENRAAGLLLKDQDPHAFTDVQRNQRLSALDGRIESDRLELKARAEAELEIQRHMTGQKQDAAKINSEIISTVKNGGVVFFEPSKAKDEPASVLIEGDNDVLYEVIMATHGRSAVISKTDGEDLSVATLDTKSRLNALKNHVTQSEEGLLKQPGWGLEANGRPLSWVRKAGLAVVVTAAITGTSSAATVSDDYAFAQQDTAAHEIVLSQEDLDQMRGRLDVAMVDITPDDLGDDVYLPTAESILDAEQRSRAVHHNPGL